MGFCEACGAYIPEGAEHWRLEFIRPGQAAQPGDVVFISSMECFLRFTLQLAEHYTAHMRAEAQGNGGKR